VWLAEAVSLQNKVCSGSRALGLERVVEVRELTASAAESDGRRGEGELRHAATLDFILR